MNRNFQRHVIISYVVLFILLIGFVGVSTINARKIELATTSLVDQKLPGLIAASQLKHHFQAQTIQLYELYATNNHTAYKDNYAKNKAAVLVETANLQSLAEYNASAASIEKLSLSQDVISDKFVGIMADQTIDWDAARAALQEFSDGTREIDVNLDKLVTSVTAQTKQQAETSKNHLAQLFKVGILFVGLLLLGLSVMLYVVQTQKTEKQRHFLSH